MLKIYYYVKISNYYNRYADRCKAHRVCSEAVLEAPAVAGWTTLVSVGEVHENVSFQMARGTSFIKSPMQAPGASCGQMVWMI